jgi:phosphoribosyl-ATP pyrophosphohydrolase/phosphoribosyl-AMP cyclohydrolase
MINVTEIDFSKDTGKLVPAIVQDFKTKNVLMLGFMNKEAVEKTLESKKVCFYSRSKQRLWTKGEESGNFLLLKSIKMDCDQDSLLIQAEPKVPTCHKGSDTCWGEDNIPSYGFLSKLEDIIKQRQDTSKKKIEDRENDNSYVVSLFDKGINKIAQKVGEEAVEVVIEAKDNDKDLFLNESADLLFHYLILLKAKGHTLNDVAKILSQRHQ